MHHGLSPAAYGGYPAAPPPGLGGYPVSPPLGAGGFYQQAVGGGVVPPPGVFVAAPSPGGQQPTVAKLARIGADLQAIASKLDGLNR